MIKSENIKQEIKDIDKQIQELRNKRYKLNEDKVVLDKKESKNKIGKCFKRTDKDTLSYLKIIDISEENYEIHGGSNFDENLYPTIMFKYPYDSSKYPFIEEDLRIYNDRIFIPGFIDKGDYEEITSEEYMEKFKEVNKGWVDNIQCL